MEFLASKLDTLTLVFCISIFAALMAAISFFLSKNFPIKIRGLNEWGMSMSAVSISFLLFFLRDFPNAPKILTVLGANVLSVIGSSLSFYAWSILLNKRINPKVLFAITLIPIVVATYIFIFLYLMSTILFYMTVIITAVAATFYLLTTLQIMSVIKKAKSFAAWVAVTSVGFLSIIFYIRVIKALSGQADTTHLFAQSTIQIIFFVIINIAIMTTSLCFIMIVMEKIKNQIIERSKRDSLTGVYSRKTFFEKVNSIKRGSDYSILMIDIDNFKKINDIYGHRIGDIAIIHLVKTIVSNMRSIDLIGRYGGDEFCVLINGDRKASVAFAERILTAIRNSPVRLENETSIQLSISIGGAWNGLGDCKTLDALLDKADTLMYVAKTSGKDKACF